MAGRRSGVATGDSGARLVDEPVLMRLVTELGPDAVAEVCAVFLADAPRAVEALRSACTAGDAVGVARGAHRLKSSSGFVGVEAVSAVCAEIETLARDQKLEEVGMRIDALSGTLDLASGELVALVERVAAPVHLPGDVHPGSADAAT